jgi:hypothetical protein
MDIKIMTDDFDDKIVSNIRDLYKSEENAKTLFDWLASRSKDMWTTSIDTLTRKLDVYRGEAVSLARALEEAGCGEFVVGRRGAPSRFKWEFSTISLGKAAAGEEQRLEAPESPVDEEDIGSVTEAPPPPQAVAPMTITQAKEALALTFGVSASSIEITIKA